MFLLRCLSFAAVARAAAQVPLQLDSNELADDGFAVFRSDSSDHSIRIKRQNDSLCDARTPQYTGWLDIGSKHLFFWYFESRNKPETDPLTLWMTGGPGGSSMLGLFLELGGCLLNKHGNGTVYNPSGWSEAANMLFVDQPAGVGFSYSDKDIPIVDTSVLAAVDMHQFLQLFVSKAFPERQKNPFFISGESYAGHYIPTLGSQIITQNQLYPHKTQLDLKGVLIGDGYISPRETVYGYWETLCTTNPGVDKPVFNETRCEILAENMQHCMDVMKTCYDRPDPAICGAAETVCWDGVIVYYDGESKLTIVTRKCVGEDDMCYENAVQLGDYLNEPRVWEALQIPKTVERWIAASWKIAEAFSVTIDIVTTEPSLLHLLSSGVDVLIYQGNWDLACNTAGNLKWASNLPWKGQMEFNSRPLVPWYSSARTGKKEQAGTFKEVRAKLVPGSNETTRFAFVTVDRSGHLLPMDQPEIALDMVKRWFHGESYGD